MCMSNVVKWYLIAVEYRLFTLMYDVQQQCHFHVMLILPRKEFRQELGITTFLFHPDLKTGFPEIRWQHFVKKHLTFPHGFAPFRKNMSLLQSKIHLTATATPIGTQHLWYRQLPWRRGHESLTNFVMTLAWQMGWETTTHGIHGKQPGFLGKRCEAMVEHEIYL